MPKLIPPPPRKRFQFSLKALMIVVLVYCGLWAATFEIGIWQLASRCGVEPGYVKWTEYPGGQVRVRYHDADGKLFDEDGFTLWCPVPFYFCVSDDETPKCGVHCLWIFGWIVPLNEEGEQACKRKLYRGRR